MRRPTSDEFNSYFGTYIKLVDETDIVAAMRRQAGSYAEFLRSIPDSATSILHPPYTWSIKQVVGHVSDAERVFAYRALRFARQDATPLAGFDENEFVRQANFSERSFADLVAEFESVRSASLSLFTSLSDGAWDRVGEASGNRLSVRAVAYILVGHVRHHEAVLRRRAGK